MLRADLSDLEEMIGTVDGAIGSITTAASNLGAVKQRVGLQEDFVSSLMDAIDRGVSQLVDANMEEESTRLQALQVQQQLGIQAPFDRELDQSEYSVAVQIS
jgi:flagellin